MEWCGPNQAGEHRSCIVNTQRLDGNDFGTRPDQGRCQSTACTQEVKGDVECGLNTLLVGNRVSSVDDVAVVCVNVCVCSRLTGDFSDADSTLVLLHCCLTNRRV